MQLKILRNINKTEIASDIFERVIAEHFDMTCDHCDDKFKSLQEAQYHYHTNHQIADGYIKCCSHRFKKNLAVHGHVLWHIKPELFK